MRQIIILLLLSLSALECSPKMSSGLALTNQWQALLDKDLNHWDTFMGVPHSSVNITGHPTSENVHIGTPLGLNNDPKKVFTTSETNGTTTLNVSGEIYGGLTTKKEYGNYHLKAKFRWGDKKWEPRLDVKRDNGILYHCHGPHGAFWNVWMSGLECQIQEEDTGDFVALVYAMGDVNSKNIKKGLNKITGDNDKSIAYGGEIGGPMYCHINAHNEVAHGKWNTIEIICLGNQSIHVVNGKVLMAVNNTRRNDNGTQVPLTSGKIQLQSEGAEAYYKEVMIKSVSDFPAEYKEQAKAFSL